MRIDKSMVLHGACCSHAWGRSADCSRQVRRSCRTSPQVVRYGRLGASRSKERGRLLPPILYTSISIYGIGIGHGQLSDPMIGWLDEGMRASCSMAGLGTKSLYCRVYSLLY
jgi:hypothetical protein